MFEKFSNSSRVHQEHMQKITTKNEAKIELFQQLTETKQEQVKYLAKLILQIETLTNFLAVNGTRVTPQEEYKKKEAAANKNCKLCSQFHKNPGYFW